MARLLSFLTVVLVFLLLSGILPADAQTYTLLHKFTGPDGANPIAGLTMDAAGNLYGAASAGGATGVGTVFKLDAAGTFTVLTSFSFLNNGGGGNPWGKLLLDGAGNIYGTTRDGGAYSINSGGGITSACDSYGNGCGAVFKLAPGGQASILYEFDNKNGIAPLAGLIEDSTGDLYGTANDECGGALPTGFGSVFKLDLAGKITSLYVFTPGDYTGAPFPNAADGGCPTGDLLMDSAGNLYGTAAGNYPGVVPYIASLVFKLTPNQDGTWTRTVLHTFNGRDGDHPRSELIFDAAGNLYGTTFNGGGSKNCPDGCGTVFELIRNADGTWTEKLLHTFAHLPAAHPYGGLVFDAAGNLYGTTVNGSTGDSGTVFKMSPNVDGSWTFKLLHTFAGKPAMHPYGTPAIDKAGNLYGTTADCGAGTACYGTIFKITP